MTGTAGQDSLLLDGILADATQKADAIIAEAKREAELRIEASKDKAEHERLVERKANDLRLEQVRLKGESSKRNAVRKASLKRMDLCFDVVLERAKQRFDEFSRTSAFEPVLVDWIAEAAIGLDLPQAKVSFCTKAPVTDAMLRKAEAQVKQLTGADLSLVLDPRPIATVGVVVSSLSGNVSYNNQVDVRFRRFDRDIKKVVEIGTCKAE